MKTKLEVTNPDGIEFTLSITMFFKDWKLFQQQLQEKWPSSEIDSEITSMLIQAGTTFYPKEKINE